MKRKNLGYGDWRDGLLNKVFQAQTDLWQWTLEELAEEAQLHPTTVRRLRDRVTHDPRSSTIYKLATAVGMDLVMIEKVKKSYQRKVA